MADIGTKSAFGFGCDPIVIRHYEYGVQGGKVLNTDGYSEEFIRAGHVVIKNNTTGAYKPMPLNEEKTGYASLPAGHTYVGVVVATIPTAEPFAGILTSGEVNDVASPYPVDAIKSAFLAAVPTIRFDHD